MSKPNVHNESLWIAIVFVISALIGGLIFEDFGASWDEPEYYEYADSIVHAYSIKDILDGTYSLEGTLGPADLRYYGPSFLLLGKMGTSILSLFFPHALSIDLWHLWVYLFFLIGCLFFYGLVRRWVSFKSAMISTIFFLTQPVLFGNAWINPKDIPLLVYFLGTIYFGLRFMDVYIDFQSTTADAPRQTIKRGQRKKGSPYLLLGAGSLALLALVLFAGANHVKASLAESILNVDVLAPKGHFDTLFVLNVREAESVPLSYYAEKSGVLYDRFLLIFGGTALFLCLLLSFLYARPGKLLSLWNRFRVVSTHYARAFQASSLKTSLVLNFLAACFFLASTSATRVIGPLAGLLVIFVRVLSIKRGAFPIVLLYGFVSLVLFYIQWPFIWQNTIERLLFVLGHMSNNPVSVNALFSGTIYDSRDLPAAYFPKLLGVTLTVPAVILIVLGFLVLVSVVGQRRTWYREGLMLLGWILVPMAYVLLRRPPMYDNYRHFLFVLPGFFALAAIAIQFVFSKIKAQWAQNFIAFLILSPGLIGIFQTHPFQYSYYNSFVGGIEGADGQYELDYWLTCYKHLADQVQENEPDQVNVYVDLNPDLVSIYQNTKLNVFSINEEPFPEGSLLFLHSRWEHDTLFDQYPVAYSVKLHGIDLCIARRVQ